MGGTGSIWKGLIEKDVVRTDRYEGDDNPNVNILRDILLTYSFYNFDLGYCQPFDQSHQRVKLAQQVGVGETRRSVFSTLFFAGGSEEESQDAGGAEKLLDVLCEPANPGGELPLGGVGRVSEVREVEVVSAAGVGVDRELILEDEATV
ncbi:uncharacterized protein HKW66_Vig0203090 [Vigna angularis]|uniref:Rab-GAP TBC domain-containing protein n=1 Tax=Phaseolus angularis TaxID=3914 RepID=A0A8T0JUT0_PHAAN|nr:uncharacterized protein HKW66_Vig0203090 [Vigna angularis]